MIDLNTIWFILIGFLFIGYAILDGFDLGVGILHLFAKSESEKKTGIKAIGPFWDGNEVWLITGGGALFAAFPIVYATVFSGFYLAMMLVLVALILRAVSLEFREKLDTPQSRKNWDALFGLGSFLAALLFGVAFGNILRGIPLDSAGRWAGSFLGLLHPYCILVGILTIILFTMHGAVFLALKTAGDYRERLKKWIIKSWIAYLIIYLITTVLTLVISKFLFTGLLAKPLFYILFIALIAGIAGIPPMVKKGRFGWAFLASSMTIFAMLGLAAVSAFPILVPSNLDPAFSLTAYNASSSPLTLKTMLIITLIGMPLVIAYTVIIYRIFRGQVILDGEGY